MRTATLYELTARKIATSRYYIELFNFSRENIFPLNDSVLAAPMDSICNIERIPIDHIRECHDLGVRGQVQTKDYYIAIEPKLRQLIEIPFIEKVKKAETSEQRAIKKLQLIQQGFDSWWAMPWYERVWSAFSGKK